MTQQPPFVRLQDLPSAAARLCLSVERFCRCDLSLDLHGSSVVIAYSGGADSKALLLLLNFLTPRLDLTLHVATLDHQLRPESAAEAADARSVCRRLGIGFHTSAKDVAAHAAQYGLGLEEAGRIQRLAFLEDVRVATGSQWIATGHQLNDLAEDCLMRMTRGAGWPALGGMRGVVAEHKIIRPLLLTPRSSIEHFLRLLGEQWYEDATNADDAYFRNRVRNRILPLFCKENPSFLDAVADRWRMARNDAAFFDKTLAALSTEEREDGIFLSRAKLVEVSEAIRLRKYIAILAAMGPGQVTAARLTALDAAWKRNEGGKVIQFAGGKNGVIKEGGILFCTGRHVEGGVPLGRSGKVS